MGIMPTYYELVEQQKAFDKLCEQEKILAPLILKSIKGSDEYEDYSDKNLKVLNDKVSLIGEINKLRERIAVFQMTSAKTAMDLFRDFRKNGVLPVWVLLRDIIDFSDTDVEKFEQQLAENVRENNESTVWDKLKEAKKDSGDKSSD